MSQEQSSTTQSQVNPRDFSVLVCDDEESIRAILAEVLAGWGFEVKTAPNGEAALEYLQAGNLPHIILTDIRMGGMSGVELAAHAKQISSEIEVVIMTSHGSLDTAVQAMRLGVYDYLSKPFDDIDDVRNVLMHVCERIYLRHYTEYLLQELERQKQEIQALADFQTELASHLVPTKIMEKACESISQAFGGAPVIYLQFMPDRGALQATLRYPKNLFSEAHPTWPLPEDHLPAEATKKLWPMIGDRPDFVDFMSGAEVLNYEARNARMDWHVGVMSTRFAARGLFAVGATEWDVGSQGSLLRRYAQTVSTFYENALLHTQVLESSVRDGLTGLFNVRYFKDRMTHELALAQRHEYAVSVLFMDVDHFKNYNDTHGHPAGDEVLRQMARLLKQAFRATEVIARYGGEEFVVLMPHCQLADALKKAESFRALVEQSPFEHEESQPLGKLTVSIGASEYPACGVELQDVIKAADDALYESKKSTRNVVSPGRPPEGYIAPFKPRVYQSRFKPKG